MKKIIVVGGGLSGIAASVFLAEKGIESLLIEASPKLGGRTYSFNYTTQNEIIDNGQHILMGCYHHTLDFLKITNSLNKVEFQDNLEVNFVASSGKIFQLKADGLFYPLNLLKGILAYKALTVNERFSILSCFLKLLFINQKHIKKKNTFQLLKEFNQSDNSIKSFWEIIHVGTLNTDMKKSSAELFVNILKIIFFSGSKSSKIVLPKLGLSEVFVENSVKYLIDRNCEISTSERLINLESENGIIKKLVTNKREIVNFDFVVSAIPQFALKKIDPITDLIDSSFKLNYSPILSVHIWLKQNPFIEKFYALIDSDIHWLFNNKRHITLVTSSADKLLKYDDKEIMSNFLSELEKRFDSFNKEMVIDYKILREKRATFIADEVCEEKRLNLKRRYGNLILAGDWTNTKFPSTIEGAIKSGFLASNEIIKEKIY